MNRLLPSVATLLLVSTSTAIAAPWHHPLYLDGTGWWRQRVPLQITNDGATPLNGFPVACSVGTAAAPLPLAGHRAESIRVCDASGTEMLYVLRDPSGAVVEQGPIPDGSSLSIPVECPPTAKVLYYVYFDNPQAGASPRLSERASRPRQRRSGAGFGRCA